MNLLGNLIWLLLGGIFAAVLWFIAGLILCVTVIGIPFGLQCFKIASFVFWPFGKEIELGHFGAGGLIFNIIWLIIFGWEFAIAHLVIGSIFCITIIGIRETVKRLDSTLITVNEIPSIAIDPFGNI
jgi:uncharacterized membrane protein YccF (DUF307 family)